MYRSDLASMMLVGTGLNRLWATYLTGPGFPILAYHEVRAEELERHLKALSPYYRFMSLSEAMAYQRPARSRPPLVLTFDDGYKSWMSEVVPVLKKRRIPAIFFPCVAFVEGTGLPWYEVLDRYIRRRRGRWIDAEGRRFTTRELERNPRRRRELHKLLKALPHAELLQLIEVLEAELTSEDRAAIRERYLTEEELRSLSDFDLEIGAHTLTHPVLSRLALSKVREEVEGSKTRLEAILDRPVRYFAYPNGLEPDLNDQVLLELRRAGFECGLTALAGWNAPGIDPMRLRRAVVVPQGSLSRLHVTASGLLGRIEEARRLRGG